MTPNVRFVKYALYVMLLAAFYLSLVPLLFLLTPFRFLITTHIGTGLIFGLWFGF